MANSTAFVGVPKREPCRKCGNPVFFAERISFEQKLYHRSCLKCARCGAQLTLGSFYETETDGEYCCETCPDEEIQIAERRRSMTSEAAESPVNGTRENARISRSSKLLERISFFESAPLSDEEKTSNMVRRAKMSSFLKDSLEKADKLDNGIEAEKSEPVPQAESSDSEDEPEKDEPLPSLPVTEPPPLLPETDILIVEPTTDIATTQAFSTDDNVEEVLNGIQGPEDINTTEPEVEESLEQPASSQENSDILEPINTIPVLEITTSIENNISNRETEQIKDETTTINGEELAIPSTEELENLEQSNDQNTEASQEIPTGGEVLTVEVPEVHVISEEKIDSSLSNLEKVPKNEAIAMSDTVSLEASIPEVETRTEKQDDISEPKEEEYPSDLNPFGDDSEEEKLQVPSKPVPSARRVSTNPFGSDDEDESQPVNAKPPRPPPPKIKSVVPANPFDEDGDDEPENEIIPIIVKPSPRRTPVPTPRKQHNHTDSFSSMETSLMSSQFGGSNISLASSLDSASTSMTTNRRKKQKAPDVPIAITKLSTENLSFSQSTTPRKKRLAPAPPSSTPKPSDTKSSSPKPTQRLITLDASLIGNDSDLTEPISRAASNDSVVYRRTIVPLKVDDDSLTLETTTTSERQWEKMKDNKEAQNRNRQSQTSPTSSQNDSYNNLISNKSQQGKWKRRKGPAPALPLPLPERKTIKMLPLKEIRQELDIIETQQQGLEKQGVILEQMIRERCEGVDPEMDITGIQTNSKEVEDLIMQLFELVNEKNELFRRQAELMYLRRQHRLEQEQADLEYEIRLLMAQPERNKTDSDKEKEEALITRLVEIVQMRNEVVDCLEMDRLREAEEDMSIKQSIEERAASQQKHGSKKDSDTEKSTGGDSSGKLSKKEKKKLKEAKKLVKSKKIDSEKDADETESSTKEKKKKKKFFPDFLHPK